MGFNLIDYFESWTYGMVTNTEVPVLVDVMAIYGDASRNLNGIQISLPNLDEFIFSPKMLWVAPLTVTRGM